MELRQLPDLCQLLESVCTARDFLLEVGGEQDRSLPQFMVNIILNLPVSYANFYRPNCVSTLEMKVP